MDNSLIFCHIPKTAGTSLRTVIHREYQNHHFLKLYGQGGDAEKLLNEFRQKKDREKNTIKIVEGHYPVGVHLYLSFSSRYITLLRNPVGRFVSFYNHIINTPSHYAYKQGFSKNMSISDFILSKTSFDEASNGMTWYLSGAISTADFPMESLMKAKKHLKELFAVVGTTEKFDESVILMRRKLGWKRIPFYYRRRVSSNHRNKRNLDPKVREEIVKYNALDIALYEYASQLLDREISEQGNGFQFELFCFKFVNRLYQKLMNIRFVLSKIKHNWLS